MVAKIRNTFVLKACFKNVNIFKSLRYRGCNDWRGGIYLNKQGICIFNSDSVLVDTLLSADNLCEQFGSRSEPTEHWS